MAGHKRYTDEELAERIRLSRLRVRAENKSTTNYQKPDRNDGLTRDEETKLIRKHHYRRFIRSANMVGIACQLWMLNHGFERPVFMRAKVAKNRSVAHMWESVSRGDEFDFEV